MKKESELLRIDVNFKKEVKSIKLKVEEISGKATSDREVTFWISKLNTLPEIKEGIVLKIIQCQKNGGRIEC